MIEDIRNADFISVSLQSTGSHGAPWRRILPFDTSETAYYKAKDNAEKFQLVQFAVCPFKWASDSKIIAFPYNFHLFPRDDLRIGMPSYSFSCQLSSITSMAQKGFDFNSWVYNGISYSSKAQESAANQRGRNSSMLGTYPALPHQNPYIADIIFMERVRSQVQHWRDACLTSNNDSKGRLAHSLMTTIFNNEMFGSRPCLRIIAASDRQMQLILEVLREFSHNLVPLRSSVGEDVNKEVKVIFTSSEEDKHFLLSELQQHVKDQCKQILRFEDVVDALIKSGKTIVGYNCLTDFTMIYSSFIAPLPPTVKEFLCSLQSIFPRVLDIRHLLKEVKCRETPSIKKAKNLHAALSYLNRQFSLPLDLEVPLEFKCYGSKGAESHGHTVLRLTYLFAKVCRLLKISLSDLSISIDGFKGALASHENILYPGAIRLNKLNGEDVNIERDSYSKNSHIIFLWGFKIGSSAKALSEMLTTIHDICQEGIRVQLVDKSCAYVKFKRAKYAEFFLQDLQSGNKISEFAKSRPLEDFSFAGLRAVNYVVYEQLCKSSLSRTNLADSLELVLSESGYLAYNPTADLPSPKNSALILELDNL